MLEGENYSKGTNSGDISELKVNINDELQKILDIFALDDLSGFMLLDGKLINSPGETTFAKTFVKDQQKFSVVCGSGPGKAPSLWVRFPEFYLTDYYYMNTTYYDAV